jgi:hypothetical protein
VADRLRKSQVMEWHTDAPQVAKKLISLRWLK